MRGADPTLAAAIRSVLDQDYPAFGVRIIVDSRDDPAWAIAAEIVAGESDARVRIAPLERPRSTCSLVCSSLLQALDELDDSWEMITFCASDMIVPRNWLRIMAAAMNDPGVGATLGNRWYLPPAPTPGSLVRYLWNSAAVVTMWWFQIPWSGGLALRIGDLHRSGLPEKWGVGLSDDVPSAQAMHDIGLKLKFVPELFIMHRDGIGLGGALRFIRRQMLWARLYHRGWPLVALRSACDVLALLAPLVIFLLELLCGHTLMAGAAALAFLIYVLGQAGLLLIIERAVALAQLPGNSQWGKFAGLPPLTIIAAIPLTNLVFSVALVACMFDKSVEWRGIVYRFNGPWQVRMVEYHPYE
jgi:glycosyltransferase involved in cell wall biosynthesis